MIVPFFTVIVVQMKRMTTQSGVFAWCYLTAVISGATFFALSNIFFLVAAFRPERDPALIQLLNDLAWIVFTAPVGMLLTQFVLLALAAIFLPGLLLAAGALPWWDALRVQPRAGAALAGAGAAVVGLLAGALYDPVWRSAVADGRDFVVAATAFVLLVRWRVAPWIVVLGAGLAGLALHA